MVGPARKREAAHACAGPAKNERAPGVRQPWALQTGRKDKKTEGFDGPATQHAVAAA
jgi:hypothetical protein